MTNTYKTNGVTTRRFHGHTPFVVGCDTQMVLIPADSRVQILDSTDGSWFVRIPGTKPNCFWSLWIGSDEYPAKDVVVRDSVEN